MTLTTQEWQIPTQFALETLNVMTDNDTPPIECDMVSVVNDKTFPYLFEYETYVTWIVHNNTEKTYHHLQFKINGENVFSVLELEPGETIFDYYFSHLELGKHTFLLEIFSNDSKTDPIFSTQKEMECYNSSLITNTLDGIDSPGSFRWCLAVHNSDLIFEKSFTIKVTGPALESRDNTIMGNGSTLQGGMGRQTIVFSQYNSVEGLVVKNRFIGNSQFVEAGSYLILNHFSYSSLQGEIVFTDSQLFFTATTIAGNTQIGNTIRFVNTILTLDGRENLLEGNVDIDKNSRVDLTINADLLDEAFLTVNGKVKFAGTLNITFQNATIDKIGAKYILARGTDCSGFAGTTVYSALFGRSGTVNGDILDDREVAFRLVADQNTLYLEVIDNCPEGAVRIHDWPDMFINMDKEAQIMFVPAFVMDLQLNGTEVVYNGTSGLRRKGFFSTPTDLFSISSKVTCNGMGTVYGGSEQSSNDVFFLKITGLLGTLVGGGNGIDQGISFVQTQNARIYNVIGGGLNANQTRSYISLENTDTNCVIGGGYRGDTISDLTPEQKYPPPAISISITGGSVWKLFGGSIDGKVDGSILLTFSNCKIINAVYVAGSGDVRYSSSATFRNVDFSTRPVIYGGAIVGVKTAVTSGYADMEQLYTKGDHGCSIGSTRLAFIACTVDGMVFGGNFSNVKDETGLLYSWVNGSEILFSNVKCNNWIFGGSYTRSDNSYDINRAQVSIICDWRGEYSYIVGAGRSEANSYNEVKKTYIALRGGTFNQTIIAGGYADDTGRSIVVESTTVQLNARENLSTIKGSIYLGGYGRQTLSNAQVLGTTKCEVSGKSENLDFTGTLSGNGFGKGIVSVSGERCLRFSNFNGDFNAIIRDFDTIIISSNEGVTLTKELGPEVFSRWNLICSPTDNPTLTIKNSAEISITNPNTERNLITYKLPSGAKELSYFLIDASEGLLADLAGLSFHVNSNAFSLIVNDKDWYLHEDVYYKLETDGNQLWLHMTREPIPHAETPNLLSAVDPQTEQLNISPVDDAWMRPPISDNSFKSLLA